MRTRIEALLAMVVVVVVVVMVVAMLAAAAPVFADQPLLTGSGASMANKEGFGPKQGYNFGQCKDNPDFPGGGPGHGKITARDNPSFNGGSDYSTSEQTNTISIRCRK